LAMLQAFLGVLTGAAEINAGKSSACEMVIEQASAVVQKLGNTLKVFTDEEAVH
jgi:hypothetical protein